MSPEIAELILLGGLAASGLSARGSFSSFGLLPTLTSGLRCCFGRFDGLCGFAAETDGKQLRCWDVHGLAGFPELVLDLVLDLVSCRSARRVRLEADRLHSSDHLIQMPGNGGFNDGFVGRSACVAGCFDGFTEFFRNADDPKWAFLQRDGFWHEIVLRMG